MNFQELRNELEQRKGSRKNVLQEIVQIKQAIREAKDGVDLTSKALEVLKIVDKATKQELQLRVSDIVTMALEAVLPDPYKFEVEFVERRNKIECDLFFTKGGNRAEPTEACGVGAVDIAAFALRIGSWLLQTPHSRATIVMDEPFRFVSDGLQEAASEMVKEISSKLGIQFVIVTHNQTLTEYADRTFVVSNNKMKIGSKNYGVSKIEVL